MKAKAKTNNYLDIVGSAGDSFSALMDSMHTIIADGKEFDVELDAVEVEAQYRTNFEDEGYTLQELGDSLKIYQIHPITVRPNREGRDKPYLLVSGGRREKAARLVGMTHLRAVFRKLDDTEADKYRMAENSHTLPVKQLDEAHAIQAFLDKGHTKKDYMEQYKKSDSWISKRLALLNLPEQTGRLFSEKISTDIELITKVKKFEQQHPQEAAAVVEQLKANKEETDSKKIRESRKIVEEAMQKVMPKKEKPAAQSFDFFAGAKDNNPHAFLTLDFLYVQVAEKKLLPDVVISGITNDERADCELILSSFHKLGKMNKAKAANLVAQGMKNNAFADTGGGLLSLAAFLQGATAMDGYSMKGVLSCLTG